MKTQLPKLNFFFGSIILMIIFIVTLAPAQNLLNAPQKIIIDGKRNRLLVSNYNSGDIVQIDSVGNQTYFVQGANFVDGLEIVGDTVYGVGNNRVVKAYNLITKQVVMNITLSGGSSSNYLSSITSDSSGHLFISCPTLNTIYKLRVRDTAYWVFAQDNGLNKPNGILLEREKNRIVVIDDSPPPALIHAISLLDSTVSNLDTTSFNKPDGIVKDKNGYYYVGGYYLPGIYRFNPDFSGQPTNIYQGNNMVYPTYDYSSHSLLVTFYNSNSWTRITLPVGINDPNELIKDFQLNQNYPNPFNPSTIIKFYLKKNCFVSLKVFDVLGKELIKLVSSKLNTGVYEIPFSVNQFSGNQLPGGIYFYTLEANGFIETKKMILLK